LLESTGTARSRVAENETAVTVNVTAVLRKTSESTVEPAAQQKRAYTPAEQGKR
jgi:hypothetical protein